MRTTVAVGLGVVIMFIGAMALSESAQQSEETAMNSSSGGEAWNLSTEVFDGIGQVAGPGVVFMGVAAIVLVSLGLLVAAGQNGR